MNYHTIVTTARSHEIQVGDFLYVTGTSLGRDVSFVVVSVTGTTLTVSQASWWMRVKDQARIAWMCLCRAYWRGAYARVEGF